MASSSSRYIAVPQCPLTFDGTNYADFAAHMRGLRLWGVLCGDVPCPPRPLAPVAPIPPTPPVMAADASELTGLQPRLPMTLQLMLMISR
jgi:hypothetical protein